MKKIYLAIPYQNNPTKSFSVANEIAASLMRQGYIVFSPISHSHPIFEQVKNTKHKLPATHKFWMNQDEHFIGWCDELHIVCLPDWEKSTGVAMEMRIAQELGKKIIFIEEVS